MKGFQFTIPSVLDCETGEEVFASTFFKQEEATIFEIRRHLEDAIRNRREPKYKCFYCQQLIKIRGKAENETKLKRMHFAHQWDSKDCPIKTSQSMTRQQVQAIKYNGQKESELHLRTKGLVAASLESNRSTNKGVTEVAVETTRKDSSGLMTWRKPDVSAVYQSRNVVFEIQLSTTFLSVIADREHFYRQNQIYIIWLFKHFCDELDKQRFTEKDVFYCNNQNAFVFDGDAIRESKNQKDLILTCFYRKPYRTGQQISYEWQEQKVGLHDLTFDEATYKVFFFDVDGAIKAVQQEISEEKRKEWLKELARQTYEHEFEQRRHASEREFEEGYSRARATIQQVLTKIRLHPENYSPLIKEFVAFSENTCNNLFDLFGQDQGYQPSEQDRLLLKTAFERERINRSHLERNDLLTCLCLVTCLIKLKSPHKTHRFKKVYGPILTILSVKLDCVVGQKFLKLVQVAHSVFAGKENYAHLFLIALERYPNAELNKQDGQSGGKLAKKIDNFYLKKVQPDHTYDDVFKILLPELFT